jgi:hypothetical protein
VHSIEHDVEKWDGKLFTEERRNRFELAPEDGLRREERGSHTCVYVPLTSEEQRRAALRSGSVDGTRRSTTTLAAQQRHHRRCIRRDDAASRLGEVRAAQRRGGAQRCECRARAERVRSDPVRVRRLEREKEEEMERKKEDEPQEQEKHTKRNEHTQQTLSLSSARSLFALRRRSALVGGAVVAVATPRTATAGKASALSSSTTLATIAWAFVPPKPKEETPAMMRSAPPAGASASACLATRSGTATLPSAMRALVSFTCSVGGTTRWCTCTDELS